MLPITDCISVYISDADPNLRDWSGRKPRQYQASQDTAVSADTFRSEYLSAELSGMHINRRVTTYLERPKVNKHSRLSQQTFLRKSFRPKNMMKRPHTTAYTK